MIAFEGMLKRKMYDRRVMASEFKTPYGLPRLIEFVKKTLGVDPTFEAEKVIHNYIFQFGKRSFSSLRYYVDAEETAYSDMKRIMEVQGLDFKIPSVMHGMFLFRRAKIPERDVSMLLMHTRGSYEYDVIKKVLLTAFEKRIYIQINLIIDPTNELEARRFVSRRRDGRMLII